ncbi:MAG TPA: PIG-L family deacetylase [Terriglobales bacterium]|nr:PIG-L family deacetylase [Terriglobales bacterium]
MSKIVRVLTAVVLLATVSLASDTPVMPAAPLPQDTGSAGLRQSLGRLRTTARLMHTVAHPDDEDGAMLVLQSRGKGVDTMLLTLNRGEGGQNKIGSNLFDVLGIVRTLELLAADRYYGVQQRFTRVADFGFTKSAAETFEKWQGHDTALRDMVRVIRTFRPEVIVSRFRGDETDGHGQHQASGILTREAFRAAADPDRFPEQIKEGLAPWQAKKLYVNVRRSSSTQAPAPEDYTVALDTGATNPDLGMSYVQFAMQGLKHQLSQGAASWSVRPGPHTSYYKLVDSVLPALPPGTHEKDFFDGIDTSLTGVASRLEDEPNKLPLLRSELERIQSYVDAASTARSQSEAVAPLLDGYGRANALLQRVLRSDRELSPAAYAELKPMLETKVQQFRQAVNLALGVRMEAIVDAPPTVREGFMAVRGGTFAVTVALQKPAGTKVSRMQLDVPRGWQAERISPMAGNAGKTEVRFRVTVPPDAPYTRQCFHRASELEAVYKVENDTCAVLPLPPTVARAVATYDVNGRAATIDAPVEVRFIEGRNIVSKRPLAVGPHFSVAVSPVTQIVQTTTTVAFPIRTSARTNLRTSSDATFAVESPGPGWQVSTTHSTLRFPAPGQEQSVEARVTPPPNLPEGTYHLGAHVTHSGNNYREGYTLITRPDIGSTLYYQAAKERINAVNVSVPKGLRVGYVMGAGDEIPSVLRQIGMDVTLISPEELSTGNLGKYGTIVLGIRAYDTRDDLRANNKRLLDYVSNGGTLVVQYNADYEEFNAGSFTPYPATLSRDRVSVEEAPVDILAPTDSVFRWPNQITKSDFEGWVQERGLYFMGQWDDKFEALLTSNDPGEAPMKGGLLSAKYGKGTYIYTGYAFFRQLPFGVPGAVRLFVNLVSAGHEQLR